MANGKTLRERALRLLPKTWALRIRLRDVDREYRPLVANAEGNEQEALIEQHIMARAEIDEELEGIQTRRLLRKASRFYIVAPELRWTKDRASEHWKRGRATGRWYLKPAAIAALQREIEEAKKRRREAWESWAKIISGVITGLVALGSVIVSMILALRR